MIVRIDKIFQKDTSKINDAKIKLAIAETIQNIQQAENLFSIANLKN